ncbi:hypothetical protein BBOV_III004325 [Babesia bovis T2Bo]|uniref:hypothetical protein n=1 Tax=Babesia bovis T2Bo TaxID=484906 RepID=UPI001C351578|nr:hypothetical protein BBOV_III004325 [Babesia bovis T2Bo]KAG6440066.1 hypothetical protein BBOV_III004325 [Babesia bovis T2Bo]
MTTTNTQENLDVDERIAQTGCDEAYGRLDDCLVRNDRVWSKCQNELREFGRCMKAGYPASNTVPKNTTPR